MSSPEHLSSESSHQPTDFWRVTAELIRTAIIVTVLAYVIRLFVLQPFVVEGSSMAPLFHSHDYLIVEKVSYKLHQPERGDIVVFRYPRNPEVNYVKRVIGLPGEKVRLENGKVKIISPEYPDGIALDESYLSDISTYAQPNHTSLGSIAEFTVGENSIFVMGDNRTASSDSREWGNVPDGYVIGKVVLQAYPLDRVNLITHARYELKK
jgi:signal peptidase I